MLRKNPLPFACWALVHKIPVTLTLTYFVANVFVFLQHARAESKFQAVVFSAAANLASSLVEQAESTSSQHPQFTTAKAAPPVQTSVPILASASASAVLLGKSSSHKRTVSMASTASSARSTAAPSPHMQAAAGGDMSRFYQGSGLSSSAADAAIASTDAAIAAQPVQSQSHAQTQAEGASANADAPSSSFSNAGSRLMGWASPFRRKTRASVAGLPIQNEAPSPTERSHHTDTTQGTSLNGDRVSPFINQAHLSTANQIVSPVARAARQSEVAGSSDLADPGSLPTSTSAQQQPASSFLPKPLAFLLGTTPRRTTTEAAVIPETGRISKSFSKTSTPTKSAQQLHNIGPALNQLEHADIRCGQHRSSDASAACRNME